MKIKVYEMEMEFGLTVGIKEINKVMNSMGFDETLGVSGPVLTIKQTLAVVPNEEYINQVCDAIKNHFETSNLNVLKCTFKGYKKFLEKEIEVEDE